MSPKEKSTELWHNHYMMLPDGVSNYYAKEKAKELSLVTVKEIKKECKKFFEAISNDRLEYWDSVEKELKKHKPS